MTVYGGTRSRLIRESIFQEIDRVLNDLGWKQHVTFVPEPLDNNTEIQLNTLSLSEEDEALDEGEMGSTFTIARTSYYLDFYGASQAIATDVTGDLVAALRGRLPEANRNFATFDVLDYRMATPAPLFSVDISNVRRDRTLNPTKSWLKNWHMVWFTIEDEY